MTNSRFAIFLNTLWDIAFEAMLRGFVSSYSPVPWFLDPMQSTTASYPIVSAGFNVGNLYANLFQDYILEESQ